MAIKELLELWSKEDLLSQAFKEVNEMLAQDRKMYEAAFRALVENRDEQAIKVKEDDILINQHEVEVRKKIIEYLAFTHTPNMNGALSLIRVVSSLEKIGDYSKSMAKLGLAYPKQLSGRQLKKFEQLHKKQLEVFDLSEIALKKSDEKRAQKAKKKSKEIRKQCFKLFCGLCADKKISKNEAVIYAMLATYMKRVASHLYDINSSVVDPFQVMGFKHKYRVVGKL